MRNAFRQVVLLLTLAVAASAQKRWSDAQEYNLYTRVTSEANPVRQIELLREWVSAYPQTEFQRERILSFALAYQKTGKVLESFESASQLLRPNANDPVALYLMVTVGPALQSPSSEQITLIANAANALLSPRPRAVGRAVVETPVGSAGLASSPKDPESQRVDEMLSGMRRNHVVREDPEVAMRAVAERALNWVRSVQ
jgi:hypothetical protein